MSTACDLTDEQVEEYRRAYRDREQRRRRLLEQHRSRAWEIARGCAELLRRKYGVERVVVFGSLARGADFTEFSELDLLVWGLDSRDAFRAIADSLAYQTEIEVNLVPADVCRAELLAAAENEGVEL